MSAWIHVDHGRVRGLSPLALPGPLAILASSDILEEPDVSDTDTEAWPESEDCCESQDYDTLLEADLGDADFSGESLVADFSRELETTTRAFLSDARLDSCPCKVGNQVCGLYSLSLPQIGRLMCGYGHQPVADAAQYWGLMLFRDWADQLDD